MHVPQFPHAALSHEQQRAPDDLRAPQRAFKRFRAEYNDERPHQYLQGRTPGTLRFKTRLLYLSTALRPHRIALEEVDDGIWSLCFCNVLLGRIDVRNALKRGQLGVTHVPG